VLFNEGVGENDEGGRSGVGLLTAQNAFSASVELKFEQRPPIASSDLLGLVALRRFGIRYG